MGRIITPAELHRLGLDELRSLFRTVSRELARTAPGTPERRAALASLENIQLAMAQRLSGPQPKPPGF